MQRIKCPIHRHVVHFDYSPAFSAVGLLNGILEIPYSIVHRYDVRELEKHRLHDHVYPVPEADLARYGDGVDGVEVYFVLGDVPLYMCRQVVFKPSIVPRAVEDENPLLFKPFQDVIVVQERLVVACDIVSIVHEIRAPDGVGAEPQV